MYVKFIHDSSKVGVVVELDINEKDGGQKEEEAAGVERGTEARDHRGVQSVRHGQGPGARLPRTEGA